MAKTKADVQVEGAQAFAEMNAINPYKTGSWQFLAWATGYQSGHDAANAQAKRDYEARIAEPLVRPHKDGDVLGAPKEMRRVYADIHAKMGRLVAKFARRQSCGLRRN